MRPTTITWKAVWAVLAVIAVTLAILVVPRATAQEADPASPPANSETTDQPADTSNGQSGEGTDNAGGTPPETQPESPAETTQQQTDQAPAEQNAGANAEKTIEFSNVRVTNASGGLKPDETLKQWGLAKFEVDWFAPNGIVNGQQFKVVYPETFSLYASESFPLVDKDNKTGGMCVVELGPRTITCTFDATFEGLDEVAGTLRTTAQATRALESREVTLRLNEVDTKAFLPGEGVGVIGVLDSFPDSVRKWGWYNKEGKKATWTINIPGKLLAEKGVGTLRVTDTLGGYAHKFTADAPRITEYPVTQEGGKNIVTPEDEKASVKQDATNVVRDGKTIKFDVDPPNPEKQWKSDRFYRIHYWTETESGQIAPSVTVTQKDGKTEYTPADGVTTNKATIDGVGETNEVKVYRSQHSEGTISGVKFGSYTVGKFVEGVDPSLIPAGTTFKVQAEVFDAANKKLATEVIDVPLNGQASGPKSWKAGTTVQLTELETPTIPGVKFTGHHFKVSEGGDPNSVEVLDGGKSVKFKTINNTNISVDLTNVAEIPEAPFSIVKHTAGIDAVKNKEFWFNYTCRVPGSDEVVTDEISVKGDGVAVKSTKKFKVGTKCEIVENAEKAKMDGYDLVANPVDFKREIEVKADPEIAVAEFTNAYTRMTGSLAVTKKLDNERADEALQDEEFKFEATWELDGKTEKREFTLRPREAFPGFPKLPLGTKVTVKEILPEDSPWATPKFEGNIEGAVHDNRDGTATVTVAPDEVGVLLTVTNTLKSPDMPPPGGWLGLLALVPFLGSFGSSGSSGNTTQTTAPNSPAGAQQSNQAQQNGGAQNTGDTTASKSSPRQLAQTGASVIGLVVLAIIIAGVGVFLVRRSRRKN